MPSSIAILLIICRLSSGGLATNVKDSMVNRAFEMNTVQPTQERSRLDTQTFRVCHCA